MVDFFNELYASIKESNTLLKQLRFYSLERFIVRSVANIVIPIYFKISANKIKYSIVSSKKKTVELLYH